MLIVKVKKGQKIEQALKQLKRKFRDTGVLKQLRDNKEFTKPSVKRRREIQKAKYIQKLRDKDNEQLICIIKIDYVYLQRKIRQSS